MRRPGAPPLWTWNFVELGEVMVTVNSSHVDVCDLTVLYCDCKAQFPFKRKRLRWQAANHGCHCFDRAFLLAACQRKSLRFLRFSFTQRTQRKRLRLNGNRA